MTVIASRLSAVTIAVTVVALAPASVFAQGHQGVPPGQAKKIIPPAGGSPSAPGHDAGFPAGVVFVQPRALGSWLDDASVSEERSVWMTVSTNRWLSPIGRGYDAPIVDVTAAVTPRVQIAATLPYSRFTDQAGDAWTGLGDAYVTAKVVLRPPDDDHIGIAIAPTLELSNSAVAFDPSADRTHWVFPVNVEMRRTNWRTYGSGGYFTRGAVFAAGALERALTPRVFVTGALTQSWSTGDAAEAEALGLSRRRTDVSGGAAWSATPAMMLYASVSRTLSRIEYDSSRMALNAGVSVALSAR